jgi:hypothetical protein
LYAALCDGNIAGVQPHAAIDAFYSELVAKHPQIDDISDEQVDDHNLCPWSVAFDRSPRHIIMCCVWSKADYVGGLLKSLAKKHGLALYDPQSERVHYPDGANVDKPWWKIW